MSGSDFDEETVLVDDSEDSLSENELSYYDTSKEHLKYVLPFVPANILITGGALVSGKLLTEAGSEVSHFNHGLANGKEGRMAIPVHQESSRCY